MTTTGSDSITYLRTETIALDALTPFPGNARRGDVSKIRESLRTNGQYRPLVVRHTADDRLIVLAGNHTRFAMLAEGWAGARCEVIECDDATAKRINLVDNRLPDVGWYDNDALLELLSSLGDDLTGTGYDVSFLDDLLTAVEASPDMDDVENGDDDGGPEDRIQPPPSLDDLAEQYGEPQEGDLWPVIRVRVPPGVREEFLELTQDCDDPRDDSVRFMFLIRRAKGAE